MNGYRVSSLERPSKPLPIITHSAWYDRSLQTQGCAVGADPRCAARTQGTQRGRAQRQALVCGCPCCTTAKAVRPGVICQRSVGVFGWGMDGPPTRWSRNGVLHATTDALGNPLRFLHLTTAEQAHDLAGADVLLLNTLAQTVVADKRSGTSPYMSRREQLAKTKNQSQVVELIHW